MEYIFDNIIPMEIVNESYIISDDDLFIGESLWKRKKNSNILFVTGFSGSGKTTTAIKLADKYGTKLIEIDAIEHPGYYIQDPPLIKKIEKRIPWYKKARASNWDNGNSYDINKFREVLDVAIDEMYEDGDTLYIVEGLQLYDSYNPEWFINKPLVIIGSSISKSILQRFKRNGDGKIEWIPELRSGFIRLVKMCLNDNKALTSIRKTVMKYK